MSDWVLGVVGDHRIEEVRPLRVGEYEDFERHSELLRVFDREQQLFTMVALNFDEYTATLEHCLQDHAAYASPNDIRFSRMVLEVNRRILNFLSSMRTFLDHWETSLNRRYGQQSDQFKRFKVATSRAYDGSFSYRFLYRLRNYAQHCGMPVGSLNMSASAPSPGSTEIDRQMTMNFNRDTLLEFDGWGAQVKAELTAMPTRFDVTPHVRRVMDYLKEINLVLITIRLANVLPSAQFIWKLARDASALSGAPCIFLGTKTEKGVDLRIGWMPLDVAEGLIQAVRRHTRPAPHPAT